MWPMLILIFAATAGPVLLWIGLRGRRVGDHPFCRRCGFDLFGKPEESEMCPECGARLVGPRSYVVGVRHRRPWAVVTGSFVLLPLCGLAGIFAWGKYSGVDWQKHKPLWYLSREADGSDVRTRDAAIAELMSRYSTGKLSKPQVAWVIAQALAAQADASKPWAVGWGDLIEAAHAAGDLSRDDWKRYAEHAVTGMAVVRTRGRVASDTPFAYVVDSRGARVGSRLTFMHYMQVLGVVIDGVERTNRGDPILFGSPLTATPRPGLSPGYRPTAGTGLSVPFGGLRLDSIRGGQTPWRPFEGLKPGPHDGYMRVEVRVLENQRVFPGRYAPIPNGTRPARPPQPNTIAQLELHLPIHIEVVPRGERLVQPQVDPSLREAVASALHVRSAQMLDYTMMQLTMSCDAPPADLSFKVFIRSGGREWPLTSLAFSRSESPMYAGRIRPLYGVLSEITPPLGPTVDVVFRPDPDPAELLTPDITNYWSGEDIVVKDVPLTLNLRSRTMPLPPARPTTRTAPRLWDGVEFERQQERQRQPIRPVPGRDTF